MIGDGTSHDAIMHFESWPNVLLNSLSSYISDMSCAVAPLNVNAVVFTGLSLTVVIVLRGLICGFV